MKAYSPMKVTLVGNVTEVVLGGNKHSGGYGSPRSDYSDNLRR